MSNKILFLKSFAFGILLTLFKATSMQASICVDETIVRSTLNLGSQTRQYDQLLQCGESVRPILKNILEQEEEAQIRILAAQTLRSRPVEDDTVILELINIFNNETNEEVRAGIIPILGTSAIRSEEVFSLMLETLSDSNEEIRIVSAESIRYLNQAEIEIDYERVIPRLLEAIQTDTNYKVREHIAHALGDAESKAIEAIPVLLKILESNESSAVRGQSARAIGDIKPEGEEVISALVDALDNEINYSVKGAIAQSLGEISPNNEKVVGTLINLLKNGNTNFERLSGASGLRRSNLHGERVIPALSAALSNEKDPSVRSSILFALMQYGPEAEQLISQLEESLQNDDSQYVRSAATTVLGGIGSKASVSAPTLISKLVDDNEDDEVKRSIAEALGNIGGDVAYVIPAMTQAFRNDEIRWQIADSIGKIGISLQVQMDSLTIEELNENIEYLKQGLDTIEAEIAAESVQQIPLRIPVDSIQRIQVSIQQLQRERDSRLISRALGPSVWIVSGHILFWLGLISVYPSSSFIQSIFFWNPWVRRIIGAGYIGPTIAFIPFLRRRLFAPFKDSLLSDARLDSFEHQIYFKESEFRYKDKSGNSLYVEDTLKIRGQVIIEGESGVGKSMCLRNAVFSSKRLTVYLPSQKCSEGVIEAIQSKLHGLARDSDFLRTLIYSGAIDILIDGLNEVSADTRGKVSAFMESYFKGNILVTTQPVEWVPPSTAKTLVLEPLRQCQISDFLLSQKLAFVRKPEDYNSYEKRCVEYLVQIFNRNVSHEEITIARRILSNPMDLTIVAQMISEAKEPDLFSLHRQQYEIMSKDYQKSHVHQFPLRSFAEEVYQMRIEEQDSIDSSKFLDELRCMERHKMVVSRQSVNIENVPVKEWYFRHDKIADYFLVQTFLGDNNSRCIEHISDSRFRGVYFLLASLLPYKSALKLRESLILYAAENNDHTVSDNFVKLLSRRDIQMSPPDSQIPMGN